MRLPAQPPQYDRNLEQVRSGEIEREIERLLAEIQRLKNLIADHEERLVALEP